MGKRDTRSSGKSVITLTASLLRGKEQQRSVVISITKMPIKKRESATHPASTGWMQDSADAHGKIE